MGKPKRGGAMCDAAPLFADDGELSAAFTAALREVFDRFDTARCGALDDAALNAFAAACNDGAGFAAEELEELKEMLDCDDSGRLTWRGFTELFHTQSAARPEDTWRDLERLGYDAQLQRAGGSAEAAAAEEDEAHAVPQAAPAAAMDAGMAAVLPLVRAAKASGAAADVAAARAALDAACTDTPGGGGALAERLRAELAALQAAGDAAPEAAA